MAEADQGDDQEGLNDKKNAGCPPKDVGEEVVDRPAEIGPRLERALGKWAAAARNSQRDGEQAESVSRHGVESPRS